MIAYYYYFLTKRSRQNNFLDQCHQAWTNPGTARVAQLLKKFKFYYMLLLIIVFHESALIFMDNARVTKKSW